MAVCYFSMRNTRLHYERVYISLFYGAYLCGAMDVASVFRPKYMKFKFCRDFYFHVKSRFFSLKWIFFTSFSSPTYARKIFFLKQFRKMDLQADLFPGVWRTLNKIRSLGEGWLFWRTEKWSQVTTWIDHCIITSLDRVPQYPESSVLLKRLAFNGI